ncbi:hypothetical protein AB6A23_21645 [Paenibacillus tarimensis]
MPEHNNGRMNRNDMANTASLERKSKGKQPESPGYDKKLDGPDRPST